MAILFKISEVIHTASVSIAVYGMSSQSAMVFAITLCRQGGLMCSPGLFLTYKHILVGIHTHLNTKHPEFLNPLFVMRLCFYFVMGLKEVWCFFFVSFSQNHCVFSSVYVVLSVVFYPIGFVFFVLVQSISTSGMSITFLNEQNVSRYYAPPADHTLFAIVYKMLSVFPFHMSEFLF